MDAVRFNLCERLIRLATRGNHLGAQTRFGSGLPTDLAIVNWGAIQRSTLLWDLTTTT